MKTIRIFANLIVALVLAAVLVGLTFIIVTDRCSRAVSATDPGKVPVQEVPFK